MYITRAALVGAIVLFVATIAIGGAAGQVTDPVTLTVSVVDQEGDAVGSTTVEAEWETDSDETGTASGTTASNGKVFIDVPEGSSVELDVDDDTYVRNRPLKVDDASARDVELGVSRSGTATVSVVDGENRPQSDARVTVRQDGRTVDRGETDDDGSYETARLERGTYDVTVVKPGYFEAERDVTVSADAEVTVTIEQGTVTLTVRALDDHFDPPRPIETGSVRVSSSVYNAELTLTDGTASLNVPVNVAYDVEVVKDGYDASTERVRVRESPTSVNATAQRTRALSVTPANERVLVGETTRVTVRNAYDEPAAGVTVQIDGEAVGETDDRGELDVLISAAENRTIAAEDGDVQSDPVTVEGVDTAAEADPDTDGSDGTGDDGSGDTDDGVPGFGVVPAVLALLAAAGAAGRYHGR
jgi:PGF-CTERM protein